MWIIPEIWRLLVSFQTSFPFNIHSPAAQILHVFCQILFINCKLGNYFCFMRSLKLKPKKKKKKVSGRGWGLRLGKPHKELCALLPLRLISTPGQLFHSNNKLVWETPRCRTCISESQTSTIKTNKKYKWDMASFGCSPFKFFPILDHYTTA